jgi:hypothetical protein
MMYRGIEGVERIAHAVEEFKELLFVYDDHAREGEATRLVDDVFELVDKVVEWHGYDPP